MPKISKNRDFSLFNSGSRVISRTERPRDSIMVSFEGSRFVDVPFGNFDEIGQNWPKIAKIRDFPPFESCSRDISKR